MAEMTGSELYTYILEIFKRTDKSTEIYKAITDTIKDMTKRHPFEEMKVEAYTTGGITSVTDHRIELPVDFQHLLSDVRLIDGSYSKVLVKLNKRQFDGTYPYLSNTNTDPNVPKHYCPWNTQILIGPLPDKTTYGYEISYARKQTSDITSSTTAVPLTGENREAVRAGVLARMFEGLDEYEKAAYWHARHDRNLNIIMNLDKMNTHAASAQEYRGM